MAGIADPDGGADAVQTRAMRRAGQTKVPAAQDAGLSTAGERIKGPATSEAGRPASGASVADWPEAGEGASPVLALDGFSGPLDHLLTLARAQRIDLSRISLTTLVEQLARALRQA